MLEVLAAVALVAVAFAFFTKRWPFGDVPWFGA